MKTQIEPWTWTKENGLAVLREPFRDGEARYNEQSIRATLANVQARRHEYATEEAWQRQLRKFAGGVACFEAGPQPFDADKMLAISLGQPAEATPAPYTPTKTFLHGDGGWRVVRTGKAVNK